MSATDTKQRAVSAEPYGAPHVLVLAVVEGAAIDRALRVTRLESIVGRGDDADVRIEDDEASKHHCRVRFDGGVATVADLGSLNGTLLNGRPIPEGTARRVRHLDEITVGNTRLLVLAGKFKPA